MRIFWKLAALPLALAFVLPAAGSAQSAVSVFVNGQRMSFDQPPIVQNGRVFVPLRGVFQQLGASVVYNNGQINATGRGRTISLTIGSTTAVVDGQQQILDVAPFVVGDRTLVPLRFIAQSLGAQVNWDDSSSAVTITTNGRNPGPVAPPAAGLERGVRDQSADGYDLHEPARIQLPVDAPGTDQPLPRDARR